MKTRLLLAFFMCFTLETIIAADGSTIRPRVIVIDPGHGGSDDGSVKSDSSQESDGASWNNATSAKLHLREEHLTLSYCKAIQTAIQRSPEYRRHEWKLVLTRTKDAHLGAMERAAVAVRESADVFFSVHFNASDKHAASGTRVFYVSNEHPKWEFYHFTNPYSDRDRRFADVLCRNVAEALSPFGGQPKARLTYDDARDRKDGLRILGYAREDTHLFNCAMGLLEVEFIDNPAVESWLLSGGNQSRTETAVADSIVNALRAWFALPSAQRYERTKASKAPNR